MGIFSKNKNTASAKDQRSLIPQDLQARQQKNFITTFSILAKLARADGRVSKAEISVINDLIDNRLQLDEQKKIFAIKIFNAARESSKSFEDYAVEFKEINKDQPQMFVWLVDLLLSVAFADQVFSENERTIIEKVKSIFGLSEESFVRLKGQHCDELEKALALLGCSAEHTIEQIEQKYHSRLSEYDPVNLKNKGLPEEFITLARQKVDDLNNAFNQVMKVKLGG